MWSRVRLPYRPPLFKTRAPVRTRIGTPDQCSRGEMGRRTCFKPRTFGSSNLPLSTRTVFSPGGGIGRHTGLRSQRFRACRFDAGLGHQFFCKFSWVCSSTGRAAVSKTEGWKFDSSRARQRFPAVYPSGRRERIANPPASARVSSNLTTASISLLSAPVAQPGQSAGLLPRLPAVRIGPGAPPSHFNQPQGDLP